MKRFATLLVCLLGLAVWLAPTAGADRKPYVFDRPHSQLNFTAEALLLTAHGFFEKFDAEVQVDPEKLENSTLHLTIETASINTRVERRDNHLRSADFFDAANHPRITFVATKITKVSDQDLLITGDLTIRAVTKSIQVPTRVVFLRDGRGRFKGEFQINRKDFGVNYNSRMNPIEDTVAVQFDLNLVDQKMQEERQRQMQQRQQQPPTQQQPAQSQQPPAPPAQPPAPKPPQP